MRDGLKESGGEGEVAVRRLKSRSRRQTYPSRGYGKA